MKRERGIVITDGWEVLTMRKRDEEGWLKRKIYCKVTENDNYVCALSKTKR